MSCGLGLGYSGLATAAAPLAGYGLGSNCLAGYHGLGLDLGAYGHIAHAGLAAATPLSAHDVGLGAYGAYSHLAHAGLATAPLNGLGLGACGSNG